MSFRDDHDAALARADALEAEVTKLRERADAGAKEAEALKRERDELLGRVVKLEAGNRRRGAERRDAATPSDLASMLIQTAIVVAVLAVIVLLAKYCR